MAAKVSRMKSGNSKSKQIKNASNYLRKGDTVKVIAGGAGEKRVLKGQIGEIIQFVGANRDRVLIRALNLVTRHQRSSGPNKAAGKVTKEAPIHVSNVMYYVEKLKRPVRLCSSVLADGKRVRGYKDPKSKEFVQITK